MLMITVLITLLLYAEHSFCTNIPVLLNTNTNPEKPIFTESATIITMQSGDLSDIENCPEMKRNGSSDGPWVPCNFLSETFVRCETPILANSSPNATIKGTCARFGGLNYEDVLRTNVSCSVIGCIECYGPRTFYREVPCVKYTGHYFLSTLLYSIFLGMIAVDRFCLGYSAIAVGKLMTLGGLGVWWIIDICLLVTGNLMPADESNWEPYY
ncbi:unnamed protein product, partial [Mesorhabditis belari]|uniref:TM2 domain-containing protein n=1 Tax=Mesorhabditis belari TaxID=2138241 RepID=A0AAF3F296_9BILA